MRHLSPAWLAPWVFVIACGGGSTLVTDGGADDGGATGGDGGRDGGAEAATQGCTPGGEVFCRCSNRDEGTKTCAADGQSFEPCKTATGPCPP